METEHEKITTMPLCEIKEEIVSRGTNSILLLPLNWLSREGETVYEESTDSVLKLFRLHGIASDALSPLTPDTDLKQDRYADWISPPLFISSMLITQNPMAVSLALNVLGNYVTELFKGIKSDPKVKLRIIQVGPGGKIARELKYEGPVSGLEGVASIAAQFKPEE